MNEYKLEKKIKGRDAYYVLNWCPMQEGDKYWIIKHIPSMAGLFELFYKDSENKLRLIDVGNSWYGGLRNTLREAVDPEMETENPQLRKILATKKLYYRYCLSESLKDMSDVLYVYVRHVYPDWEETPHSGRYEQIYLAENSPDKIIDR